MMKMMLSDENHRLASSPSLLASSWRDQRIERKEMMKERDGKQKPEITLI